MMNQDIHQSSQLSTIAEMLVSHDRPVSLFTLSWCSYCHAVKQLLRQINVPFTEYELDSGDYAAEANHQRLRQELQQLTNSRTLPQVFVAKQSVGGYTETQSAIRSGQFSDWLSRATGETDA